MGSMAMKLSGAVALSLSLGVSAHAATIRREVAGKLPDGREVEAFVLTGANGVSARVLAYGATLQSLSAPDRQGRIADVLLGYDALADYVAHRSFFGVTVGRFANRIGGGRFTLDGRSYTLSRNNNGATLHGGEDGFDKRLWRVESVVEGPRAAVTLALTSPDGDQGFPGKVEVRVTYALDEAGALTIDFAGTTDRPTVLNMTNHAIFNLAGEGAPGGAMGHRLTVPAAAITPVDEGLIPTGALRPVAGTAFDFRNARVLDEGVRNGRDPQLVRARGYDHNFALDKKITATPQLAARLEDPRSGRVLEVLSTEPGLQLYTGNFLDGGSPGKGGHLYRMGDGIALEPQKFPDAPNQKGFASARIDPAQPYRHIMIYRLSVAR